MHKKITHGAVSLALAACLLFNPQSVPAAEAASFKDTEGHWSKHVVEKSYALDLMKGYPGELFKPEDPVTRLEAIAVIIRAMGLEEEARSVDYKNSGINLPQGMFWGQGHLVVAVQKGLLHKDYVGQLLFGHPIPRQEVATLVAVALRDKLKVKGDPQKLTYSDLADINTTYLPYVADVTQNNIMKGMEANKFGPDYIMNRGMMAALMVKTVQDGWFSYGSDRIINGSLALVDSTAGVISLKKQDGAQIPKLVDAKTILIKDSKPGSLADFKIGDQVTAITDSTGKVRYLEGSGSAVADAGSTSESDLTGKVIDRVLTGSSWLKIRDTAYQEKSYPLAAVVTITDGTGARDLSSITDNTYVKVKVKNNSIYYIRVLQSEEVTGEVTGITSSYITVRPDSGSSRIFNVRPDNLKIARGSSRLSFSELKNGDRVKLVSASGEAVEIAILTGTTPSGMEAEVRTVDSFYRMITLLDDNMNRKEYEVEINAVIEKGNDRVRLDSLKQGDRVRVKFGSNGKITEIIASGEDVRSVSGDVTGLKTGSSPRIYVDSKRYEIGQNARITRDGDSIDLDDIMIGAEVQLGLDEDDIVTRIEVTDDEDIVVEGEVTDVGKDDDKITIEQSNGLKFTLRVDSDCEFRDYVSSSSSVSELDDIRYGWDVKLYLENGRVKEIRIVDK
ncbi:MAG: S-layer homology domain-containing protein [Bacillota bacterium]